MYNESSFWRHSQDVPATDPSQTPGSLLPPVLGNPETVPDGIPVVPLPPMMNPSPDPEGIPVAPLPPLVGNPSPNTDATPSIPLPPLVGIPPRPPVDPGKCNCGTIRFLNAASNYAAVRILIDSRRFANRLEYEALSPYSRVSDGFHTVMIANASFPGNLLYRGTIPFRAGETLTPAIIRTNSGIDLIRIPDIPCNTRYRDRACLRAANLIYNSPGINIMLNDGRTVFSDIQYKEVTTYKQAFAKEYGLYAAQYIPVPTPYMTDIETVEELPITLNPYLSTNIGDPLVSFYVDMKPGGAYTIYLLGNWSASPIILCKVVEDL